MVTAMPMCVVLLVNEATLASAVLLLAAAPSVLLMLLCLRHLLRDGLGDERVREWALVSWAAARRVPATCRVCLFFIRLSGMNTINA